MNKIQIPESPHDLAWDITTACNLNCRFCYNVSGRAHSAESRELIDLVLENIKELKPLHLGIGGGEPLLSPYIKEILQEIVLMGSKTPMITINSMEIHDHEPVIRFVKTLNEELPDERIGFYISVHGTENTHDAMVGKKGHFHEIIKGVDLLKKYEVRFAMGFVPTIFNKNERQAVLAFAQKMGATLFNVSQFVPIGKGQQKYNLTPHEYNELTTWVKMQNERLNHRYVVAQERWLGVLDEDLFRNELFIGCSAGIYYLGLRSNGDIVPCQLNGYVLDNIRNSRLRDVWHKNVVLEEWRRRNVKGKCGMCHFLFKCGGCRCNAVAYTGDFLGEDLMCPFTQAELTEQYQQLTQKQIQIQNAEELHDLPDVESVLKDLKDDTELIRIPALSTTQGDTLIIRHERIDALVELTGDARVIYELVPDDTPITFGELAKLFEEKMRRRMLMGEFSDLVKYELINFLEETRCRGV
ncbi:MAG: radical SAM protein [Theionarchaea archaeon]|nr:radical SAM protein [Theionarchaea archaeon]